MRLQYHDDEDDVADITLRGTLSRVRKYEIIVWLGAGNAFQI